MIYKILFRAACVALSVLMAFSFGACGKSAPKLHRFEAVIGLQSPVEVGIVNPQGDFFWLMSSSVLCPGVSYDAGKLNLELSGLSGIEFDEKGGVVSRNVFVMPGVYKVMVSDNLETELENSFSRAFDLRIEKKDLNQTIKGVTNKQCKSL
ncbi:hypothetical protein ACCP16_14200 [Xanthomonas citri pv. malvacearum]|uniref:hypothetical protein n=1 Tax=Xanthomonas TaxID=338 RepID=UPI000F7934CC|nr:MULTISPECIES: hypothetical protein [Xanthomonas]